MLLSTGSNAATYFVFHFSAETKRKKSTKPTGIRHMFKKACKSHTDSPVIFQGVAVMKPGGV
jgi:hypothetical protein